MQGLYIDEFKRRHGMGERGPRWLARSALTNGELGEFAAPTQQDLWSQMRFGYALVETRAQFDWWAAFIRRHSVTGYASAELSDKASGPCELLICYFEFNGIPCMVVPLYRHRGVGLAQGIVKLTRNFDTHGFFGLYYESVAAPEKEAYPVFGEPSRGAVDGVEDMSIRLLAQVCKTMQIDLLFASPIDYFRDMLLVYIERNHITHWLGQGRSITGKGDGIETTEIEHDLPAPAWWKQRSARSGVYRMRLHYGDGTAVDLGHLARSTWMLFPDFDIIEQRWRSSQRYEACIRSGELDAYYDEYYPYNFLWLMAGEGMLIMNAAHMAVHAPL